MTSVIFENLWILFIGIGSWMLNRLTTKIDTMDKKIDTLNHTSIGRVEFTQQIASLHTRCNELEKSKQDVIQTIRVVKDK
jgi:hypothetical protein